MDNLHRENTLRKTAAGGMMAPLRQPTFGRQGDLTMGFKSIRIVGVISALLSAALLGGQLLAAMGTEPPAALEASGSWLALLLVSILAASVGPILEVQSIQIANLQRQLAERK